MNIIPLVEDGFDVARSSRTTAAAASGATVLAVGAAVSNFVAANRVTVTLDGGSTQANTIASVQTGAQTITLGTALSDDVLSGATVRVRVIDTLSGGMDTVGPMTLNGGRDFVGFAHLFLVSQLGTSSAIPQVSPNGGADYINSSMVAANTGNAPYAYGKLSGTHAKFLMFNQTTDDWSLYLGLE